MAPDGIAEDAALDDHIGTTLVDLLALALGALLAGGLSFDEAIDGLSRVATVPGRMERFGGDKGRNNFV